MRAVGAARAYIRLNAKGQVTVAGGRRAGPGLYLRLGWELLRLRVKEQLGLEGSGGMVRGGSVHYNTVEEIRKFGESLRRIAFGNSA